MFVICAKHGNNMDKNKGEHVSNCYHNFVQLSLGHESDVLPNGPDCYTVLFSLYFLLHNGVDC